MLVEQIHRFISELKESKELSPSDEKFTVILLERFMLRADQDPLTSDDIQFVLKCFKERAAQIIDDDNDDYLLNPSTVNQIWVSFAHEIAPFTGKNYLQILLPCITNQVDFNNLTPLTETAHLENFYLGYDKKTLYRKRGLCEHLLGNKLELSTCRKLHFRKLEQVTIEELARLSRSKQQNANFSINEEKFDNFWDFLQKKVFPNLQTKGKFPLKILPQLLLLIESYYCSKDSGADIKLFKNKVQNFFKLLYQYELADINFLYGVKIPYQEREIYLLELFISIYRAKAYDVDEELKAMAGWLYQINPALKAINKELSSFYNELKPMIIWERMLTKIIYYIVLKLYWFHCLPLLSRFFPFLVK
ncbi:hypothetical protein [Legionella norrlandica]|uniref:hypothetical protein n=1 Tax=Legionella norrlandica TaxID=1498499 RepID=UPI000A438DB7|nr:hypothetical protein [Legionella norrlandica]